MKNILAATGSIREILSATLWVLSYGFARFTLDGSQLSTGLRIAVALLPALPFAFLLFYYVTNVRSMDELHRRVHLEALAVAFPLTLLLVMTLGLLDLAVGLSPDDWSYRHLLPYIVMFYFLGLSIAWNRYK
jgi:hypothetical protein